MQSSQLDLKNMVGQLFDEKEVVTPQEEAPKKVVVEATEGVQPVRKSFSLKKTKQEPKYQGKSALLEQQHNPLFGGEVTPQVQPVAEKRGETLQEICEKIQTSYPNNPNNKELIEKVSKRLSESTHNPFSSSTEQVSDTPAEYSENLMSTVGGFLSDTAKFDDEEIERSYFEERFDFVQKQLEGMKRSILENTVVSGIGHGMYGSSSGGGEVMLNRMDDVDTGDGPIPDGNTLIWSSDLDKWVTADVYDGLITVSTHDVNLYNASSYNNLYNALRDDGDDPTDIQTQEDANLLNIELLQKIDHDKPDMIIGGSDSTYDDSDGDGEPDGKEGDMWMDGVTLKVYINDEWVTVKSDGPTVHMSPDLPATSDSTDGDFWFNTSTGGMSIHYTDDETSQWVSVSGYDTRSTTTTIEELQVQITNLQNRISDLETTDGDSP